MGPIAGLGLLAKLKSLLGKFFNVYALGGTTGGIVVRQPSGVAGTNEIQVSYSGGAGLVENKSGNMTVKAPTGTYLYLDAGAGIVQSQSTFSANGANFLFQFTTHIRCNNDVGLIWNSVGCLRMTGGTTATPGVLLSALLVEANTAGSGSPNVLLSTESGTVLTNEGATAENYHTLPSAAATYVFEFYCQDADGIRVVAAAGDTIRDLATVSAVAGYIRSSTVGSVIRLVALNATEWFVASKQGTWTIDV